MTCKLLVACVYVSECNSSISKDRIVIFYTRAVVLVPGILTPTDEFQYWADLATSGAKGEDRERARYFSDTFQRQIAPQFATLSTLSMADVTELMEETQDVLDEIWKQTDFDKPFPEARMRRLLEVIGADIVNEMIIWFVPVGTNDCFQWLCTLQSYLERVFFHCFF